MNEIIFKISSPTSSFPLHPPYPPLTELNSTQLNSFSLPTFHLFHLTNNYSHGIVLYMYIHHSIPKYLDSACIHASQRISFHPSTFPTLTFDRTLSTYSTSTPIFSLSTRKTKRKTKRKMSERASMELKKLTITKKRQDKKKKSRRGRR